MPLRSMVRLPAFSFKNETRHWWSERPIVNNMLTSCATLASTFKCSMLRLSKLKLLVSESSAPKVTSSLREFFTWIVLPRIYQIWSIIVKELFFEWKWTNTVQLLRRWVQGWPRMDQEVISKPQSYRLWLIMLVSCDHLFTISVHVSASKMISIKN